MKFFSCLTIILCLVSCQESTKSPSLDIAKEEAQIRSNVLDFSAAIVAGNIDGIMSGYTKDAKIFPNGSDILSGPSIQNYWTPREGRSITHHKVTPIEISVLNETAYDHGYYEGVTKYEDGKEDQWKGKYVIVWKKVDGEWKMYLDIWKRY